MSAERWEFRAAISNAFYDARNRGRTMEQAADDAADAVMTLSAAGRLRDDREGETVTEWGVRVHTKGAEPHDYKEPTGAVAKSEVRRLVEHLGNGRGGTHNGRPFVGAHVVTRERTRFPDVVTDWSPVAPDGGDES